MTAVPLYRTRRATKRPPTPTPEQWRAVPGTSFRLEVSNYGRIRLCYDRGGKRLDEPVLRQPAKTGMVSEVIHGVWKLYDPVAECRRVFRHEPLERSES